jgi:hypothetical protein
MPALENELDANQSSFFVDWTQQASANWNALRALPVYKKSYRHIAGLQALKNSIVIPNYDPEAAAFFFEAHNDAVVSHVSASIGAWRSALQALRSCIENVLCAVYYKDHPIERQLWAQSKFVIGFTELLRYCEQHPMLASPGPGVNGLELLKKEYSVLSKAVHASATNFRMTDGAASVLLWSTDGVRASMWATREQRTIEGICLLLICLHSNEFQGARLMGIKEVMSLVISANKRNTLKRKLHITLPSS